MSVTAETPGATPPENEPPLPTLGRHMFVDRPKVYPADVKGLWRRIKWGVLATLLAVYYLTPWLRWDRGPGVPDQAVLLDMAGRRGYFFFIEIWPQEIYYLTGLLIIGALGIFFTSTLFGRVWCGYSCPQTVWTDLYMWVERKIEGGRSERIRLDKAPLSLDKLWRKTAKHAAWMLIALLTGGAWIFYFNDAPTLAGEMLTGDVSWTVMAFIGLFTASTYFLAGWAREQVCIYLCPWRSYQSAMTDEDTFLVTYQGWKGEPRAPLRKSQGWEERAGAGVGECIDCKRCVNVCPTGTDIRKGQQISCIGCGLCIDACNEVMGEIGHPGGLIRFDTQSNQCAAQAGEAAPVRLIRPRTIIYTLIMLVVAGVMAASLLTRPGLDVSVIRDRAPLFVTLANGDVQNAYTIKILNKTHEARRYRVSVAGLTDAALSTAADKGAEAPALTLAAAPDSVATYRIFVRVPAERAASGSTSVAVVAEDLASGERGEHQSVFLAP